MAWVDPYTETAEYALKVFYECIDIYRDSQAEGLIIYAYREVVEHYKGMALCSDHASDDYNDRMDFLRETLRICEAWQEYTVSKLQNGRQTRWVKISDRLALNGKACAALVWQDMSDQDGQSVETWALHLNPSYNKLVKRYETAFSIRKFPRNEIEFTEETRKCFFRDFLVFVCQGLEAVGYATPRLWP